MSTYTPIASQIVNSTAGSIIFTGIPQGYTDLVLVANTQPVPNTSALKIRFNNDASGIYYYTQFSGNGSSANTTQDTGQTFALASGSLLNSSNPSTTIININDYSSTSVRKQLLNIGSRGDNSVAAISECISMWDSTAAITTISIFPDDYFTAGSTFNLYGIVSAGYATGGSSIKTDGTYWYHTFTSSGTFTPLKPITTDMLVVAGGGGGGGYIYGGGGGAGGLVYSPSYSLSAQTYTITVGAGGSAPDASRGNNGSDSSFGTIYTATGGGGGGSWNQDRNGRDGGSGGGGSENSGTGSAGIATQASYGGLGFGNNGGTYASSDAGGGGGAGAAGSTPVGGIGKQYSSFASATGTGDSGYYAGGGTGGRRTGTNQGPAEGGLGGGGTGGGTGSNANRMTAGATNTGGGGGGNTNDSNGGGRAGGSGIVIVRYPV